ncbi:MAG: response regulator transcription factor, partial [Ramlibacter sp.]
MNPTIQADESERAAVRTVPVLPAVHVVDDEVQVRTALARLLGATGDYQVHTHANADAFLAGYDPDAHACVVLDIGLPGLNGVGLQAELIERGHPVPIVFLSGSADVPMCASALRHGAVDFLTKPVDESLLFAAVARALAQAAELREQRTRHSVAAARMASLTP